jgi:hypothetical protein
MGRGSASPLETIATRNANLLIPRHGAPVLCLNSKQWSPKTAMEPSVVVPFDNLIQMYSVDIIVASQSGKLKAIAPTANLLTNVTEDPLGG